MPITYLHCGCHFGTGGLTLLLFLQADVAAAAHVLLPLIATTAAAATAGLAATAESAPLQDIMQEDSSTGAHSAMPRSKPDGASHAAAGRPHKPAAVHQQQHNAHVLASCSCKLSLLLPLICCCCLLATVAAAAGLAVAADSATLQDIMHEDSSTGAHGTVPRSKPDSNLMLQDAHTSRLLFNLTALRCCCSCKLTLLLPLFCCSA
jgi:hypothetical protein